MKTVRNCAAVAVGEIGIGEAEDKLIALLKKEPPDTQISMLFALGEIRSEKGSPLDYPVCEVHIEMLPNKPLLR